MPRHLVVSLALLGVLVAFLLVVGSCGGTNGLDQDGAAPTTTEVPPAVLEPDEALPGSRGPVAEPTALGAFTARPVAFETEGLRVAAFNVEFLFDGEAPDGQADFAWKEDPVAARNHRNGVARIIRSLDADVIMLQEVENQEVLDMMITESLADLGYTAYYVRGRDTFTRQDIGLLSRIPVEAVGRTDERAPLPDGRTDYGVSKNLWARVRLGNVPTTLIGVHFLSRPDDASRVGQREAQAAVIARLAEQEFAAGREVIVLGDFNDFDPDVPDVKASEPITNVLRTIKAAGPGLRNVAAEVPQAQRFTALWDRNRDGRIQDGELSSIDHLLLSPRLYEALREVTFAHAHDPTHGPDHFPIVVTLGL